MSDYQGFIAVTDWIITCNLICGCEITKLDPAGYDYICRCETDDCLINLT